MVFSQFGSSSFVNVFYSLIMRGSLQSINKIQIEEGLIQLNVKKGGVTLMFKIYNGIAILKIGLYVRYV